MVRLEKAAEENARNMTSETVYRLHRSLEREYSKDDVEYFNRQCPTKSYTSSFGLRVPDDLKEAIRLQGKKHGNSLNKEIVMRVFFSDEYTAHHIRPIKNAISDSKHGDNKPENVTVLSPEEHQLLAVYRDLQPHQRRIISDLMLEMSGPKN